jgi:hypothetical protein
LTEDGDELLGLDGEAHLLERRHLAAGTVAIRLRDPVDA